MKILCIDDKGRPPEIPIEKWVVKGEEYTPIFWSWHDRQGYVGVELAEITLDESNDPYSAFRATRFAIRPEDLEEWLSIGAAGKQLQDQGLFNPSRIPESENIKIKEYERV